MFSLSYIRFMKIWNIFFRFFQKINPADTGPAGFENGYSLVELSKNITYIFSYSNLLTVH